MPSSDSRINAVAAEAAMPPADAKYELGLTCAALGNLAAAITALQEATAMRPAMGAAWHKLGEFLAMTGDTAGAQAAYRQEAALGRDILAPRLPPHAAEIEAAETRLLAKIGDAAGEKAGALLRARLRHEDPRDVAALRLLADIVARRAEYEAARAMLLRALEVAPDYAGATADYAQVLVNQGKYLDAIPILQHLAERAPDIDAHRALLALCLSQTGDYDRAIALYRDAGEAFDQLPALLLNFADSLKYAGQRNEAVQAYRIGLSVPPIRPAAWWSLANMKGEAFSPEDVAAMRHDLADASLGTDGRIQVQYALGSALEMAGDYAASFAAYAKGAALKRAAVNYTGAALPGLMQRSKAFFTKSRFAAGGGCEDDSPIFIVGLPRAGSTLVEQILASHSAVEGTRELPEISNLVRDIGGPDARLYPDVLANMSPTDIAALGARYIARTKPYRKTQKPYFIDKMPANWAHAGLIAMILPNAKIIDVRRRPMAGCFAAFKQLFGHGAHYSYDLADLAQYYRAYADRMAHYETAIPGRIHRLMYETLVMDTEAEIRRLLAYCGLPFEPACLRFWETTRAVATPSAEQVRQPIFRDALDQWRNYEPWLTPLAGALGKAAFAVA